MIRRAALLTLTAVAGIVAGTSAMYVADRGGKTDTETIVRDYILAHPELIPEAMARLQQREAAKRIAAMRGPLEAPFAGAWAGNPKGDVTLVMFTDYSCGFCRASAPDIQKLLAADPKLKVVWREIPILGPQSVLAAQVALAAAKQNRYPAFHTAVFSGPPVDATRLRIVAQDVGLDSAQAHIDSTGPDVSREIAANLALASQLGVDGTPAFVVGDQILSGAVGHDALAQAIAAARHP